MLGWKDRIILNTYRRSSRYGQLQSTQTTNISITMPDSELRQFVSPFQMLRSIRVSSAQDDDWRSLSVFNPKNNLTAYVFECRDVVHTLLISP